MKMLNQRLRAQNWKLHAVRRRAAALGLAVKFVRKAFGPRHVQNRVYVNQRRCQRLAVPLINGANCPVRLLADFHTPSPWAEFLIYVPACAFEKEPFYIIPASVFEESTAGTTRCFTEYQDRWDLLTLTSERAQESGPQGDRVEGGAKATIPVVCIRRAAQTEKTDESVSVGALATRDGFDVQVALNLLC